jgi:hypothetical protein
VIYQLKVTLDEIRPRIWRRLRVPGEITMADLHHVIQIAMGWSGAHRHRYVVGGELIGAPGLDLARSVTREIDVRLVEVALERTRFRYEYDFGDRWAHEVLVERVLPSMGGASDAIACLDGRRACPPEDCGGPDGYEELLEILDDPQHAEHADRIVWVGGAFDAEAFDCAEVNERLRQRPPRLGEAVEGPPTLLH